MDEGKKKSETKKRSFHCQSISEALVLSNSACRPIGGRFKRRGGGRYISQTIIIVETPEQLKYLRTKTTTIYESGYPQIIDPVLRFFTTFAIYTLNSPPQNLWTPAALEIVVSSCAPLLLQHQAQKLCTLFTFFLLYYNG